MLRRHLNPILVITFLTITGCQQSNQPSGPPVQQQNSVAASSKDPAEEAKEHVQKYVDQFLGGNTSLKGKLLGLAGVDFDTVDSISVVRSLPLFSEGKRIDNTFTVVLKAIGHDSLHKKNIERTVEHSVFLKEGKWVFIGMDASTDLAH